MNQALGNAGAAVVYIAPVEGDPVDQMQSLGELARDMDAGQVDLLVIAGGNPVYDAPRRSQIRRPNVEGQDARSPQPVS